jgi:S-adenosylmethionine synthetase
MVLDIEGTLNANTTKGKFPWIGSDIKTLAFRIGNSVELTICVPQISTHVSSLEEYKENRDVIFSMIRRITDSYEEYFRTEVHLTTGDKSRQDLIYMLYTGSCIESGDEGQVGRGNRIGGLISSRRPFSIEGLSGKNPQYHGGKLYSVIAWELANKIWEKFETHCEVYVASQTDRPLDDPWMVVIRSGKKLDQDVVNKIVYAMLKNIASFTDRILKGKFPLS